MSVRPFLAFVSLLSTVLLTGCLIPERFSAKVDVQPDASYSYAFEGTLIDPIAVMKLQQQGFLSDKDQRGLAAVAEKLRKDPDVKKASYSGKARYLLEMEGVRAAHESLKVQDLFTVQTSEDGVMTIAATSLRRKAQGDLAQMGIVVQGSFTVHVPAGVQVLSHNATVAPSDVAGSYSWRIGNTSLRPEIRLRWPGS